MSRRLRAGGPPARLARDGRAEGAAAHWGRGEGPMKRVFRGRVPRLVIVAVVALAATGGVALATTVVSRAFVDNGKIRGCVGNGNGQLRVLATGEQCKNNEVAIQWDQQGSVGPQGPAGQQGPKGDPGTPGAAG